MSDSPQNGPILVVIGTRPEAVKLAPVVQELRRRGTREVVVCHSGQHQDLFADAIGSFGLAADVALDTMAAGQSLPALHGRLFTAFGELLERVRPGTMLVQGDTATVAVAGWAAFLSRVEVAHVEAGLRSGDKWQPFPEEVNRRITSVVADWHFAPTPGAVDNLLREHLPASHVVLTGNTVVDALLYLEQQLAGAPPPLGLDPARPIMLVTAHRRENFGPGLLDICAAVRRIAVAHPALQIVVPVHPNPDVGATVHRELGGLPSVQLTAPLSYRDFVGVMVHATLALSDSGGVQEEGPCIGLPVLVMREVTERPEGVAAGAARLVGTDQTRIVHEVERLLTDPAAYASMAVRRTVYGDGLASARIADILLEGRLMRPGFVPGVA